MCYLFYSFSLTLPFLTVRWHLGFCNVDLTPTRRGFDTFMGFLGGSEDYFTHKHGNTCLADLHRNTDIKMFVSFNFWVAWSNRKLSLMIYISYSRQITWCCLCAFSELLVRHTCIYSLCFMSLMFCYTRIFLYMSGYAKRFQKTDTTSGIMKQFIIQHPESIPQYVPCLFCFWMNISIWN